MNVLRESNHFSLNSKATIKTLSIGHEENPVVVVDNLLADPQPLLVDAFQNNTFQPSSTDYYPGIRRPIDGDYSKCLSVAILESLQGVFKLGDNAVAEVGLCCLSLTTTKQEQLKPIQSLPHFDTSNPLQLAVVHYLCSSSHGGTSFYRHRQTGFESISSTRVKSYARTLKQQVVSAQFQGKQYMNGDNDWFERIGSVEAKFNRAILFQGKLLHSGDINPMRDLSSNPQVGRLTATTFINYAKVGNQYGSSQRH